MPIAFQRQQALSKALSETVADKVAAVLAEDVNHSCLRVPAESAPNEFVDIVVAALRIGKEANRILLGLAEDGRFVFWARVNAFTSLGERISHVPIRHRVLALT